MHRFLPIVILAFGHASGQDLAGPAPVEVAVTPSLVERAYDGRVVRLETTPEEAAVALLDLDEPTTEAAAGIFVERAEFFDAVVASEVDRLVILGTAGETGDVRTLVVQGTALYQRLEPLFVKGRLEDRVAGVLPDDQAARFRRLVREYWRALIDERLADPTKDPSNWFGALIEAKAESVAGEIERSFERLSEGPGAGIDLLVGYLRLRPDQERRIRPVWAEYLEFVERGEEDSERAQRLMASMLAHLDEKQRKRLLGM